MPLTRGVEILRRLIGIGLPDVRPVFLHIPKIAGSSIHRVLAERYQRCWRVSVSVEGDMPRVWAMPEWKFRRCAYYAGHFGMETVNRVRTRKFAFTFLREPLDRVLSHYYYFKGLPTDAPIKAVRLAHELSLLDYVKCDDPDVRHTLEDVQARQFIEPEQALDKGLITADPDIQKRAATAIGALSQFDFIGLTERFDDGLELLSDGIGFSFQAYHENATDDRRPVDDLSVRERDAVEELIRADRIVYRWAVNNWQAAKGEIVSNGPLRSR